MPFFIALNGRKGIMEKTINFKNDPVFRRAVKLEDNKNYNVSADIVSEAVCRRAGEVKNRILNLTQRGKFDEIDMQIITLRQRSPVPTWRELGNVLHLSKQAVHHRAEKIKESINIGLSHNF